MAINQRMIEKRGLKHNLKLQKLLELQQLIIL